MNCKEALRFLYEVIDKEAGTVDTAEVKKHLQHCRHCLAKFEFEQMFRTFVTDKGRNLGDNDRLKGKILKKLDELDAAGEVGTPSRPFRWLPVGLAAAALILCVTVAIKLGDSHRASVEFDPFVEAHFAHQDMTLDSSAAVDPFGYLFRKSGIKFEPLPDWPMDHIRSVSLDTIKGIEFGRIDLDCDDHSTISVFVTTRDRYHLPAQPVEIIAGRNLIVHCCSKCNLVGKEYGNLVLMIVGHPDHKPGELARLTSAL